MKRTLPLAEAQGSLSALEKALIQMNKDKVITLTKGKVQNVVYTINGTPSTIWKISKMEPDEPSSAVFSAQNCYQKQDLQAILNAIMGAARKLEVVNKSYIETRDKVFALGK